MYWVVHPISSLFYFFVIHNQLGGLGAATTGVGVSGTQLGGGEGGQDHVAGSSLAFLQNLSNIECNEYNKTNVRENQKH